MASTLRRDPYRRSLKHCWHCSWAGLDHPNLLSAPRIDEDVKAWAWAKSYCSCAVWIDGIGSYRSAGVDDKAI